MKTFFLSLLTCICLTASSEKLGPDYHITGSAPDKSLKRTEAIFAFTFFGLGGKPAQGEILYSCDKINHKEKVSAGGKLSLKLKPGKHVFQFFYTKECDEIYTDSIEIKPGYLTDIRVYFRKANSAMIVDKPVIYVYGKEKVSIQLALKGEFTFTYPEYTNGWDFTANPDGTIQLKDKKYHYLFWDGKLNIDPETLNLSQGFIVDKKEQVKFFEEKLQLMGLNAQEIEDYITYWCPRMSANEKNYIHFIFNETYNNYATLTVNPKPDHLFRVCMLWTKADAKDKAKVKDQKIENFSRGGLTVVEWGGTEINEPINLFN